MHFCKKTFLFKFCFIWDIKCYSYNHLILEYNNTKIRKQQCRVPTQNNIVGRRQCRLLYSDGATGIDILLKSSFRSSFIGIHSQSLIELGLAIGKGYSLFIKISCDRHFNYRPRPNRSDYSELESVKLSRRESPAFGQSLIAVKL